MRASELQWGRLMFTPTRLQLTNALAVACRLVTPQAGYTALNEAACAGHAEVVRLLLESGADVEARGEVGLRVAAGGTGCSEG